MSEGRRLNLEDDLVGRAVIVSRTSKRLGKVSDALVNPTDGTVIALSFHTPEGEERWLAPEDFRIDTDSVLAAETEAFDQKCFRERHIIAAYACRELIGTKIVTDEGKLLGQVTEVQISAEDSKFFYRVAHSKIEQMLTGGFLMAGDAPRAYFPAALRLIVPADLLTANSTSGFSLPAGHLIQTIRDFVSRYGVICLFVVQTILILWFLFA